MTNPSDPVEELVSKLMLKVSGIIKKYGNPTVYPPEMNKELDAAYYEAKAKINRLLVEARIQQLDELIDIESKQFMRWSQKDIAHFFERVGAMYRNLSNQLKEGGEK